MGSSRPHPMAPWALASVAAMCGVYSALGLATSARLPFVLVPLGIAGLALSVFIFGHMLYKRANGDKTWGAPPYTGKQSHHIFWSSCIAIVLGLYLLAGHYS